MLNSIFEWALIFRRTVRENIAVLSDGILRETLLHQRRHVGRRVMSHAGQIGRLGFDRLNQSSQVRLVGRPPIGTDFWNGDLFRQETIRSGLPIVHWSSSVHAAGGTPGFPSTAPPSTDAAIVLISRAERRDRI